MSLNLPKLKSDYKAGQLFKHTDGGYYQYEKSVLFADDSDELIIYKHVWPFEVSDWARRYSEFKERFTPVNESDLSDAKCTDRIVSQKIVEDARVLRRSKKVINE